MSATKFRTHTKEQAKLQFLHLLEKRNQKKEQQAATVMEGGTVHRIGDDPCQESDKYSSAGLHGELLVPTTHSESIRTAH